MNLASNITEVADVVELIKELRLPRGFASKVSPAAATKYLQLWDGLQETN